MSDRYQALRSQHPLTVLTALGYDTSKLKKRNGKPEWFGPCPICKPKQNKTAFSIHEGGKFNCFAGGEKGRGAIDLVRAVRNCGFQDAVAFLEGLGPPKTQTPRSEANNQQSGHPGGEPTPELKPLKSSYHKFKVPCPWLEARIPDAALREKFGIFCYSNPSRQSAYNGKVMIPVRHHETGQLYAYLARTPEPKEGEWKYLFPASFPKHLFLFGAHELKAGEKHRYIYLVESPWSVMKFTSFNLPAVSPYGWSVSDEQLQILQQLTKGIIYLPDANKVSEAESYAGKMSRKLWVRMPEMPVADPELMTHSQILAL